MTDQDKSTLPPEAGDETDIDPMRPSEDLIDEAQKPTIPPPGDEASFEGETTVLASVPKELLAETGRGPAAQKPPAGGSSHGGARGGSSDVKSQAGGLRQMFSRDPAPIRASLPTDEEGDALLDMLFNEASASASPSGAPSAATGGGPQPPAAPIASSDPSPRVPQRTASPPPLPRPSARPVPPRPPPRPGHTPPPLPPRAARTGGVPPASPTLQGMPPLKSSSPPPRAGAHMPELPDDEEATRILESVPLPVAPASPAAATEVRRSAVDRVLGYSPHEIDELPFQSDAGDIEEPPLGESGLPTLDDEAESIDGDHGGFRAERESARPFKTPLPSRPPPSLSFEQERDANDYLLEAGLRESWLERASWLRAEAQATEDKPSRARMLLHVAELAAMTGDDATALEAAAEARELAPAHPLAHRQLRHLFARDGAWPKVLAVLDAETRVMPTPAARCHGVLLGAEIARTKLGDADSAAKRVELATRANPADPRAYVQRLADTLASTTDAAAVTQQRARVPETPALAPLLEALDRISAHRGVVAPKGTAFGSPYEALLRVRAALGAGDVEEACAGLEALGRSSALAGGASWLGAMLAAARTETRPRSIEALRNVVGGSHGAHARRALAARAIELGDAAAARAATDAADSAAFGPADRVALGALSGAPGSDVEHWLDATADDVDLAVLAAAAGAAMADTKDGHSPRLTLGSPRVRAAVTLARVLARAFAQGAPPPLADPMLVGAVERYTDAAPDAGLTRVLNLELDAEAGAGGKVARAISSWRGARNVDGDREGALAGALLAEVAGEIDRAVADIDRVRAADPAHEGAARVRAAHADPGYAAVVLAEHAQALEGGTRAAVLLTEAAMRLQDAGQEDEATPMLQRAAKADATVPFAPYLGERAARGRGDRDGLIEWLRLRRESTNDAAEQALDLVREALLLSDAEGAPAAPLLEQALRTRPKDIGLRELYERLCPEPPADRAEWRAERANELSGSDVARLALEAALEFERNGDIARAAACARQAVAAGDNLLAPICVYRCALAGDGAGDLIDALLPRARESTDPIERLEIYERLAALDEYGRRDAASGLLWRRSILEDVPGHLPTLLSVLSTLVDGARDDELESVALDIAKALQGPEAIAHALLSARLRLRMLGWDETREAVALAFKNEPRGIWVLRQMAAHARAQGEFAVAAEADTELRERTERPSEQSTLSLRAGQSAAKAGDFERARELLGRSIDLVPGHFVAHLELASVLEQAGDAAAAAAALEGAASASVTPEGRALAWYRSALLWSDKANAPERARLALEAVAEIDPAYEDVFARLQTLYVAAGARAELAALLERRLQNVTDPNERVDMEVLRGRALAEVGDTEEAKRALAAALDHSPDHVDALAAFAEICAAEGDWSGAEQAWIRLARTISDASRQADIYLRLGEVYDEYLPNPERAELAYQEILKRTPTDERARERLVNLYKRGGDVARALEQQNLLIEAAEGVEAKCRRTTELATIYEANSDLKKAEATLLQARKTWPKDEAALGALVRYYQRTGQAPAANVLLDRAAADARRALGTGRFEAHLFSTIATVSELRGRPDGARVALSAVHAIEGAAIEIDGAGGAAGDSRLDDLLAPDVLTPAFRELLKRTGPLLDAAVPFDLASVRAAPMTAEFAELHGLVQALATSYQMPGVEVFVSPVLPQVAVAATAYPPTIVIGQALAASPRYDVRTFLIHRALKVLQSNSGAFSRTAPIDLWPLLAAYLKALSPNWNPTGVDAGKLNDAFGRITGALRSRPDTQLAVLAADVIGSIGNRASTLNTAVNGWGDRAGLLAVGDPNLALAGIAWASGTASGPPGAGKERLTWIGRNTEARDLIVFSVSDAYAEARHRLGLGRE